MSRNCFSIWRVSLLLLCVLLLPFVAVGQTGGTPLTDDDVIAMVKGGLAESTVIGAIAAQDTHFDVSAAALIKLKQQGVSPKIMSAMMEAVKKTTPAYAAAAPGSTRSALPNPGNSNFANVPEPNTFSLYKLYMASNYDIIDTQEIAWKYHILFNFPRGNSRACTDLYGQLKNEFTRRKLLTQARSELKSALVEAKSWPKVATFRLKSREQFGDYDFKKDAFPITPNSGFSLLLEDWQLGVDISQYFGSEGGQPAAQYGGQDQIPCYNALQSSMIDPSEPSVNPNLNLKFIGVGKIRQTPIPMDPVQAQAYRNAQAAVDSRKQGVDVEILVEVGPAIRRVVNGVEEPIPARVIAARVLNPTDGRVLYTYDPSLFGNPALTVGDTPQKTSGAVSSGSFPLTSYRMRLLAFRDNPELIDGVSLEFAKAQIRAEQQIWQMIHSREHPRPLHQEGPIVNGPAFPGLNPKRPTFIFEWQKLIDERPELARGALLDVFLRPDADWSFVKRETGWDDRLDSIVEVFLFAREAIEGRNPEFAARELTPVLKKQLQMAASKTPTKFWYAQPLPGWDYDFSTHAIRFHLQNQDPHEGLSLLRPVTGQVFEAPPDSSRDSATVLPANARSSLVYALIYENGWLSLSEPPEIKPGIPLLGGDQSWRDAFPGLGQSGGGAPELALDHQLVISSIPMDPKSAERLMNGQSLSGKESGKPGPPVTLTARTYIEADHVELGESVYQGKHTPFSVLFARLQKVEIRGLHDELVATLDPETFRGAKDVLAAGAAAQTKANAEKKAKEAEDAANRKKTHDAYEEQQRQIKDDVRRQSEEGSKKLQIEANQRTQQILAHVKKQRECDDRAFKVNNDRNSSAYKEVYDACMQEK